MKDFQKTVKALFSVLSDEQIRFSRVLDESMEDRAVAMFTFDLKTPACILSGFFIDGIRELASIAHEAGHVMIHRKMNRAETRNYVCTMFVINKMGLDRVSPDAQEYILEIEAEASENGLYLLKKIEVEDQDLRIVKEMMSRWYASYENQCSEDIVQKVRVCANP